MLSDLDYLGSADGEGTAARNPRSPHSQDAQLGSDARLRHRALDRTVERERAADRGRLPLPRALSNREKGLGRCVVGCLRQPAAREVLPAHGRRAPPAAEELDDLVQLRPRGGARVERETTAGVMSATPLWRRCLRFGGSNPGADVDDEFAFHVDTRVDELLAQGLSRKEAHEEALRGFGNIQDV